MQSAQSTVSNKPKRWTSIFPRIFAIPTRNQKYESKAETVEHHSDVALPSSSTPQDKLPVCHWSDDPNLSLGLFTRALEREGLLLFTERVRNTPVLTICHGFLNVELAALKSNRSRERQYRLSMSKLDPDTLENYSRLFGSHYPLEPLVDGLPESVWLECVEPSLSILKSLSLLKRRKNNLALRKARVDFVDSNLCCRGDSAGVPLLVGPQALPTNQVLFMRARLLALEGAMQAREEVEEDIDNAHV